MIREKIRQFFEQLMEELDELEEAHTIITCKSWVLWNDREGLIIFNPSESKIDSNEQS